MSETVGDWLALVEDRYPRRWAAAWDRVGLQVGDPGWPVTRVLVALDVTVPVVEEAAEVAGTLLLAHHPVLFQPLAALTPSSAAGRRALAAARAGVAVAAVHTNLDVSRDGAGTSDPVADLLGLRDRRSLTCEEAGAGRSKLVTFVPPEALEAVIDAVAVGGAGRIGDYERCTFRVRGTGTFRPLPGADPYSGEGVGRDAHEDEFRLEVELPTDRRLTVVTALMAAHPYEEVAYDLYPVLDEPVGFGILGTLPDPTPLEVVADRIRAGLPAPALRTAGEADRLVERVAVVGGAGDALVPAARDAGADLFITGDLRHHVALDALEQGLALIDAGHHATEVAALPALIGHLRGDASARGLVAPVVASGVPTAPWR